MRLLRTDGDEPVFEIHNDERNLPPYAVLSHTWMSEEDEVTLNDLQNVEQAKLKPGWKKLDYARRQARADGLDYLWQDTCCIDKSSSAELTEAINSMWRWYQKSSICYAYLVDMPDAAETISGSMLPRPSYETARLKYRSASFSDIAATIDQGRTLLPDLDALPQCRWFKRGWTLQEMLAPKLLCFFSERWTPVGGLQELADIIAAITGVNVGALRRDKRVRDYSIAQRMSWAGTRICTRVEDVAYSLMGIFEVNMPIIYGEGAKAFRRLQEEIARAENDHSLYAWEWDSREESFSSRPDHTGLFAPSPKNFNRFSEVVSIENNHVSEMTNRGIRIDLVIMNQHIGRQGEDIVSSGKHAVHVSSLGLLKCRLRDDCSKTIALNLRSISKRKDEYVVESRPGRIEFIDSYSTPALPVPTAVTILHPYEDLASWRFGWSIASNRVSLFVRIANQSLRSELRVVSTSPPEFWDAERQMLALSMDNESMMCVSILLEYRTETRIPLFLVVRRYRGARSVTPYLGASPAGIDSPQSSKQAVDDWMRSEQKGTPSDRIKRTTYLEKGIVLVVWLSTRNFVGEEVFVAELSVESATTSLHARAREQLSLTSRTPYCVILSHES